MTKRWGSARFLADFFLGLALVIVPALLLALAYASPPDPSWIPGVYDDADWDDVIVQVTSAAGHVPVDLPLDIRPVSLDAEELSSDLDEIFVSLSPFQSPPRAPPGL